LELELSNLLTLISFDNKSIKALLAPDQLDKFDHTYPIFFKEKPKDLKDSSEKTRTAIDIALEHNQIQAVDFMISYIVQYQSHYSHSYIFQENFTDLLEHGIKVDELLKSDIFYPKIEFSDKEWPQVHTNSDTMIMAFNPPTKNLFQIRNAYPIIFEKLE
jgi:hypothetical protein